MPPSSTTNGSIRTRGNKTHALRSPDAPPARRGRPLPTDRAPHGVDVPAIDTLEDPLHPLLGESDSEPMTPLYNRTHPDNSSCARVYVGDCREIIPRIPECAKGKVDLIFADPPFNWKRAYDEWDDEMPHREYLDFTYRWLDLCVDSLRPGGSLWINIPDDWAAEIVMHLKYRRDEKGHFRMNAPSRLKMVNWCIWHYRFGQNTTVRFINSKVHALYFVKPGGKYTWNPKDIVELSDRRAIYGDPRTESKNDGMPAGLRVPMDVWYGQYWGRVQGNSKERRGYHDNQLPEVYLARVIRACSNKGDLVMDPFLGSGTTGVVAHALGRDFIGTEYSEKNAKSAFERIGFGPIRDVHAVGQSTAIFPHRRKDTEGGEQGLSEDGSDDSAEGKVVESKPPRKKRRAGRSAKAIRE